MWDNCKDLSVTDISLQRVLQKASSEKKSEHTDKKKNPSRDYPDLVKENVHSIGRDILVYVSENVLMEYTGEAEIHRNKIVLH